MLCLKIRVRLDEQKNLQTLAGRVESRERSISYAMLVISVPEFAPTEEDEEGTHAQH